MSNSAWTISMVDSSKQRLVLGNYLDPGLAVATLTWKLGQTLHARWSSVRKCYEVKNVSTGEHVADVVDVGPPARNFTPRQKPWWHRLMFWRK